MIFDSREAKRKTREFITRKQKRSQNGKYWLASGSLAAETADPEIGKT